MDKPEDKNKVHSFPAPFEYLNEELSPQLQRFHELENMRKAYNRSEAKPKDLKPAFTPQGYGQGGPSNNQNSLKIEAEIQKLDSLLTQKIENVIKELNLGDDLSNQLRETLVERKYPNPFIDKSPKEIEWLKTNSKDLETSAQFLLDQRRRSREKDSMKMDNAKEAQKDEVIKEPGNKNGFSMSTKFTQSLNYTKIKETPKDKVHDFNKNKDIIIEK